MTFDPTLPIKLRVTKEIIDSSVRENESWCMVDRAIQLQIPGATRPKTSVDGIRFTVDGVRFFGPPPEPVGAYVVAYDAGAEIAPFELLLTGIQPLAPSAKRGSQPRVADVRLTTEKPTPSPRTREFGRKILRANQGTVDDDLAAYDRIRAKRKKGPPAAYKELAESLANIGLGKPSSVGKEA